VFDEWLLELSVFPYDSGLPDLRPAADIRAKSASLASWYRTNGAAGLYLPADIRADVPKSDVWS
jgi:hypothetical protein